MARRNQKQEQGQPVADEAVVSIVVTDLVEADYEKRGVFPELRRRLTNWYPAPKAGGFWVPVSLAVQISSDATAQHISCVKQPKLAEAYMSLMLDTVRAIRQKREGYGWKDPGRDEVVARVNAASACWDVGDVAVHFGNELDSGAVVEIVYGYGYSTVITEHGHFVSKDGGETIEHRPGYIVRERDTGRQYFTTAGNLTTEECKPSHLRLVWSAPPENGSSRRQLRGRSTRP
jgi:hypothetical protein